jgi:hypothetical protein
LSVVVVFQLSLWEQIQDRLLFQDKRNMAKDLRYRDRKQVTWEMTELDQINFSLSNYLVNEKSNCWTVTLNLERKVLKPDVVLDTCNPSTQEAEAGGVRPAWAT